MVAGALAAGGGGGGSSSGAQTSQLAQQMQQLETVTQAETETVQANTQADESEPRRSGRRARGGASVGSTIESALGSGAELAESIGRRDCWACSRRSVGGGGGASVPSTFLMPPSVDVNAGMSEGAPTQPFAVDYASGGAAEGGDSSSPYSSAGSGQGSSGQITVQVQAMDSQSFLDHSDDIAQAVRQAMLQSSVLNDVIREV